MGTNETPLEDQRQQALKHYEEASNAIMHWSSFVRDAIMAYDPKQNSHKHGVMQAEGSAFDCSKYNKREGQSCDLNNNCKYPNCAMGAAVGQRSVGTSGSAGCVHNTLEYIGPWYSCKTCGTHFNARAEAPSEGACDF